MKKVLLIDDAATVRMYHRAILEKAGFTVDEAANGIEAMEKALAGVYDLFVVDINMPKLDGYGFLKRLRTENFSQAPAIMISTEAEAKDQSQAWVAGANDYLTKPVKPEELLAHVNMLAGEIFA
jgi:two-component system chemotaxis response regulator CheY